jgi:hypothetical protein
MYCWHIDQDEYSMEGPFDTLQACKEHILGCFLPEHDAKIVIAKAKTVEPEEWANGLYFVEDVLERMDEVLCDEIAFEDRVFSVPKACQDDAQKALNAALVAWAKEYIETGGEWSCGEVVLRTTVADLRREPTVTQLLLKDSLLDDLLAEAEKEANGG